MKIRRDMLAGFTMIELLVVIAVIGILAVATLSAINPIEQINKGRDTRLRSNAAELLGALDRFYSVNEMYPWNKASVGGGISGADTTSSNAFPDTNTGPCTATAKNDSDFCQIGGDGYGSTPHAWLLGMADAQEVKTAFINQIERTGTNDGLWLVKPANGDVTVCFTPASKQFQMTAVDDCVKRDGILPAGACPAADYEATTPWTAEMICLP